MNASRSGLRRVILALAIAIGVLGAQAGGAAPIVDLSLGSILSEDFEAGDGGFEASEPVLPPITSSWAHGMPTSGPGVAASGLNVWATNLSGTYLASECSALLSPPITIPSGSTASVSFLEWHHMQMSTTLANDAGRLYVTPDDGASYSLVTPAGGYTSPGMGTTARACLQDVATGEKGISGPTTSTTPPAPTYTAVTTDISAFAGQTVRFAIAFGSDSSTHRAGWYIDDFSVTIDGSTTTEDFEAGDGGFTIAHVSGTLPVGWEYGMPTTGPSDPTNMWATNLDGNYGQNECATLTSPEFTVSALPVVPNELIPFLRAQLSWEQFFDTTFASSAAGVIQVGVDGVYSNITPTTGYSTSTPSSLLNACLFNGGSSTGAYSGGLNAAGDPLTEIQADLTPFIGQTITLRWVLASTPTASRDIGWYVDNINVEMFLTIGEPEPPQPTAPGWTSGGDNSSWAYGLATAGPTGETAWGTNLAGNYNQSECSFIQAPAFPGSALTAVPTLTFSHWYEIESVSGTTPFDGGFLIASTDGGATWSELTPDGGYPRAVTTSGLVDTCKASYGLSETGVTGGVYGGNKQSFDAASVDMTAFAAAEEVTVRFVFSSDTSVVYDGWFIKDVAAGGVPLLPPAPPSAPDGGTDHPGWTHGGVTSFAYGVATAGPIGETAYGTNLDGTYGTNECGYIEAPALPGVLVDSNPVLAFDHWYEIESKFSSTAYDGGFVLASTDGGTTWTELTPDGGYPRVVTTSGNVDGCKNSYGLPNAGVTGGVYSGDKQTFDGATFDLSSLAGATDVRLRFVFASDGVVQYNGWFIKNVTVAGIPLTLSAPSSI